jgi:hypothetical protein
MLLSILFSRLTAAGTRWREALSCGRSAALTSPPDQHGRFPSVETDWGSTILSYDNVY